jgi:hypothetical protein
LVIRVLRDPAENTSTSPLPVGLAEAAALAEVAAAVGLEEVAALEELELEEELLQPAAASPIQAINTGAAICTPRRLVRKVI